MKKLLFDKLVLLSIVAIVFALFANFLNPRTIDSPTLISLNTLKHALFVNYSLILSLTLFTTRVFVMNKHLNFFMLTLPIPVIIWATYTNASLLWGAFEAEHELAYTFAMTTHSAQIIFASFLVSILLTCLRLIIGKRKD